MSYVLLMFIHICTVLPCVFLGGILLIVRKGTRFHKTAGRIYMLLMLFTASVTLFMPANVGPRILNHFGWIHLFSFLTIYTIPTAYMAIRKGNVQSHKRKMLILYFSALIVAGGFTLFPGRYLHNLLFR